MKKVIYSQIADENYLGVLTMLDYEISVRKCLSEVLVATQDRPERKILVDLALKVGVNKYRFVVYNITDTGEVIWNSGQYIIPCEKIVELANSVLLQRRELIANSMLSSRVKETITGELLTSLLN